MNKFFPKWISPRAFILASLISAVQAFRSADTYGFSTESVVYAIVQVLAGGLFWGWILTRFLPKYFGRSNEGGN